MARWPTATCASVPCGNLPLALESANSRPLLPPRTGATRLSPGCGRSGRAGKWRVSPSEQAGNGTWSVALSPLQQCGRQPALAALFLILAGVTPLQASPAAASEQVSPAAPPRFQTDLLPILRTHCLRCHNSEARLAGLDLSTEATLFRGSASGSVLVPAGPRRVRSTGWSTRD